MAKVRLQIDVLEDILAGVQQIVQNTAHKARQHRDKPPEAYTEAFEAFWAAYPRKKKKRKAFEAWVAKKPPAYTLDAVGAYAQSVRHTEERYILLPASWLNAESWLDEDSKPIVKAPPKCKFCGAEGTAYINGVGWMCSKLACKAKQYEGV